MAEQKNITLYVTPTCPWCHRTADYISSKGFSYTKYDVASDREKAREMIQKSGQMGVPVITIGQDIVVGFNQARIDELLAK
ncbi:MAG: glutathione S-transferase N-terminal domain-containing protein [Dehalococcoidales bacterium]|nr:glutathione S-transferase N-terminal domain-containing protein [Dehalococcoidales bacterium]